MIHRLLINVDSMNLQKFHLLSRFFSIDLEFIG